MNQVYNNRPDSDSDYRLNTTEHEADLGEPDNNRGRGESTILSKWHQLQLWTHMVVTMEMRDTFM